jgi:hypothetical protein
MPIEIQFTDDNIGINFCAVGEVSGKEIIEHLKEFYQSDVFPSLKYWIVDREKCVKYDVSANEVNEIAKISRDAAKKNPDLLEIIISPTDLQYGVSSMYEAYLGDDSFKTIVVRDKQPAKECLKKETGLP